MFWKKAHQIYYIYTHVYICIFTKSSSPKHCLGTWYDIGNFFYILNGGYHVLEKSSLHINVCNVCTYSRIYMWGVPFQKVINSNFNTTVFAMPMPIWWIMFWKKNFFVIYRWRALLNAYIYAYIYNSFPKHSVRTWYWHCKAIFWIGAYTVLEKRSSYEELFSKTP